MLSFLKTVIYEPLYNVLVLIIDFLPGHQVGFAVIVLTILVRILLVPLFQKSLRTQLMMKKLQPEMKKIQQKYKDNREEQGKKIMALYREAKVNPFASFLVLFIQLPIVISLYYIISSSGLPVINHELVYSFVPFPNVVDMNFFGVNLLNKNFIFAVLAGLASFAQAQAIPAPTTNGNTSKDTKKSDKKVDFAESLQKSMTTQIKYVLPFFMFFISLNVSGAVALYFIVSSLFSLAQEVYFKQTIRKKHG